MVEALHKWVADHGGRLPRGGARDDVEQQFAAWLMGRMASRSSGDLLDDEWDELVRVPGVRRCYENNLNPPIFEELATSLSDWTVKHGKLPNSTALCDEERALATFLRNQRGPVLNERTRDGRLRLLCQIPGVENRIRGWRMRSNAIQVLGARPRSFEWTFEESIRRLQQFLGNHGGRLPRMRGLGVERRLWGFLNEQRRCFLSGRLSAHRRRLLLDVPGMLERAQSWEIPVKRRFDYLCEAVGRWAVLHKGHLPKHHGGITRQNPQERQLAEFLSNQHMVFKKGRLSEERRRRLESLPGMADRLRQWKHGPSSFEDNVKQLEIWVFAKGCQPSRRSTDREERRLGCFLDWHTRDLKDPRSQRLLEIPGVLSARRLSNASRLEVHGALCDAGVFPEVRGMTPVVAPHGDSDEMLPATANIGVGHAANNCLHVVGGGAVARSFNVMVDELKDWIVNVGSMPKQGTQDVAQQRLARFVSAQQRAVSMGVLVPNRQRRLEEVPGMRERIAAWEMIVASSTPLSFNDWVDALLEWTDECDRLPRYGEGGAEERKLGDWLNHQRVLLEDDSHMGNDRLRLLLTVPGMDALVERWRRPRQSFDVRIDELEMWMDTHGGNIPTSGAHDKQEQRLAAFLRKQREHAGKGKLQFDKRKRLASIRGLTDCISAWPDGQTARRETFDVRVEHLMQWMEEHQGRRPKQGARNPEQHSLAKFLQTSIRKFSKDAAECSKLQRLASIPGLATFLEAQACKDSDSQVNDRKTSCKGATPASSMG